MALDPDSRGDRDETGAERHDRQLGELLQGLRVALPGVQVIFGFLLTVPFSARFDETTDFQRDVYFATLLLTALATILLMAPTAIHRSLFRRGQKRRIVQIGHRLAIGGLAMLALSIAGALVLVADILFDTTGAVVLGAAVVVLVLALWVALPLAAGRRAGPDETAEPE